MQGRGGASRTSFTPVEDRGHLTRSPASTGTRGQAQPGAWPTRCTVSTCPAVPASGTGLCSFPEDLSPDGTAYVWVVLEPRGEVVVPAAASRTTVSFCLKKRCLPLPRRELLCVRFPACQPCVSDGSVPCSRQRDFSGARWGLWDLPLLSLRTWPFLGQSRKVSSNVRFPWKDNGRRRRGQASRGS